MASLGLYQLSHRYHKTQETGVKLLQSSEDDTAVLLMRTDVIKHIEIETKQSDTYSQRIIYQ